MYDNKCSTNSPMTLQGAFVLATCKSDNCNRIAGTSNPLRRLDVFTRSYYKSCSSEPNVYGCQNFTRVAFIGHIG